MHVAAFVVGASLSNVTMQGIEMNQTYNFNSEIEDGKRLGSLCGGGFVGMENIGNTYVETCHSR